MNFGTPVPLLVGVVLIVIGIGLFFLDSLKPGYKRDSDTVYGILFMVAGLFSLFSLNADFQVALQFMVSAGTLVALMIERIQVRGANNGQARSFSNGGGGPSPREERPSRAYRSNYADSPRSELRVELEDDIVFPAEEPIRSKRIRGSQEGRSGSSREDYDRDEAYVDRLVDDTRSSRRAGRSSRSTPSDDWSTGEERSRRRRPLQIEGVVDTDFSDESAPVSPEPSRRRRSRSSSSGDLSASEPVASSSRSRRRRSTGSDERSGNGEYVDFKPLNTPPRPFGSDDEFDNSSNFDDDFPNR
ncbi:MAG TPA: Ycf66 family protein [Stenomitos sp.]